MEMSANEQGTAEGMAEIFHRLYGSPGYRSDVDVAWPTPETSAEKAYMRWLAFDSNLDVFCRQFEARINQLRSDKLQVSRIGEAVLIGALDLPLGTKLISVHPKQHPRLNNNRAMEAYWRAHRIFKVTRNGLEFVPFDPSIFME